MVNTTEAFKIPAVRYVLAEEGRRMRVAALCLSVPVAVLAVASLADIRYLILALMVLLVAYPGVMAIVWLSALAHPGVARRQRRQRWIVDDAGITVEYLSGEPENESEEVIDSERIDKARIAEVEYSGKYVYIKLNPRTKHGRPEYYIIEAGLIPAEALPQL